MGYVNCIQPDCEKNRIGGDTRLSHKNNDAMTALHTLQDASRITGIEPARIRFIEREFKEFLGVCEDGMQDTCFDRRGIALLDNIHRRIFHQGESFSSIRAELGRKRKSLRTIAVTSGKGGVGKTTVSINLAIAMARRGLRTLVFDADMGLGNVHVFAGITPRGTVSDVLEGRAEAEDILSMGPENIHVLCGGSGSAKLADLSFPAIERLGRELAALGEAFDVMLIDTGAGISAQVTHFLAMADDIVVVTTPNIAATLDAYGVVKVARESSMRGRIHVLVNQVDDEEQGRAVCEKISLCAQRFLQYSPLSMGSLTRDPLVEESNQKRHPLLLSQPEHENAARIVRIAEKLCASQPTSLGGEREEIAEAFLSESRIPAA